MTTRQYSFLYYHLYIKPGIPNLHRVVTSFLVSVPYIVTQTREYTSLYQYKTIVIVYNDLFIEPSIHSYPTLSFKAFSCLHLHHTVIKLKCLQDDIHFFTTISTYNLVYIHILHRVVTSFLVSVPYIRNTDKNVYKLYPYKTLFIAFHNYLFIKPGNHSCP